MSRHVTYRSGLDFDCIGPRRLDWLMRVSVSKKNLNNGDRRMIRSLVVATFCTLLITPYSIHTASANDVIETAGRYTVKITTAVDYSFGNESKGTWRGAGFLVDRERGWIITIAQGGRIGYNFDGNRHSYGECK